MVGPMVCTHLGVLISRMTEVLALNGRSVDDSSWCNIDLWLMHHTRSHASTVVATEAADHVIVNYSGHNWTAAFFAHTQNRLHVTQNRCYVTQNR